MKIPAACWADKKVARVASDNDRDGFPLRRVGWSDKSRTTSGAEIKGQERL